MVYEFRCRACGRRFDVVATLAEKEAGLAPVCPACGSADVGRVYSGILFLRPAEKGSSGPEGDRGEAGEEWGREGRGDAGVPGADGFGDGDGDGADFDGEEEPGFHRPGDGGTGELDGGDLPDELPDDEI